MDKFIPYGNTPIFWGRQYNKTLQYVGHCDTFDEVLIQGDVMKHAFIGFYIKDGQVCAASAQGKYKEILTIFEAFNQNKVPSAADLKSGRATLDTMKASLKSSDGCVNCRCRKAANLAK